MQHNLGTRIKSEDKKKKKVRSEIRKNFKGSESFKQSNAPQTSLSDGKYYHTGSCSKCPRLHNHW